jgi:hypothetical protein
MGTEYGAGEEAPDVELWWRLSWEKSVLVMEAVESWPFSLTREMHVVTKSEKSLNERKREGKHGKGVKSEKTHLL